MTPDEQAARAELSAAYGHPLSDAEWTEIRTNLLTFFGVLAEWQCVNEDNDAERHHVARTAVK
jgi:hypothetical protein